MKKLFFALAALCGLLALGCPDPGKSSPAVVDLTAELTGLTADGSVAATTTKLSLTFDQDITGLTAADLTLGGSTGATAGTLTRTGTGTYDLALSGITDSGAVTVSVYKTGYIFVGGPKQVTVYYHSGGTPTQAAFNDLTADGSAAATTTKLSLTFDRDITGLAAGNITLGGNTGATAGILIKTGTGTGTYELTISGITQGGTVTVTVAKSGYDISPESKEVTVYYNSGQTLTQAAFNDLSADGSPTQTTTKLSLTFDRDITGLTKEDLGLNARGTGATAGTLTKTGTGTYDLPILGITQSGTVTVTVDKSDYNISPVSKEVTVYHYNGEPLTQAAFNDLSADGSPTQTTTKLSLTFDKDITGLAAGNIRLEGNTGATAGNLTRTGTGTYDLSISGITQSGTVTVKVAKSGYNISPSQKTAQVFYYHNPGNADLTLTLTFAQIADSAPAITGPTLYRLSSSGPATATLTVENPEQYTSISWRVQDTDVTGTGASFTLDVANTAYNQIASHFVTVTVMKDNVPYNKTVSFKVEL